MPAVRATGSVKGKVSSVKTGNPLVKKKDQTNEPRINFTWTADLKDEMASIDLSNSVISILMGTRPNVVPIFIVQSGAIGRIGQLASDDIEPPEDSQNNDDYLNAEMVSCGLDVHSQNSDMQDNLINETEEQKIKLHYIEAGDRSKPLMLFLHGFPEFWYSWRNQIKHFSSSYWVVAPDLRGFGESDRPTEIKDYDYEIIIKDIAELVKTLGRREIILVAHDWGGVVAYGVAARYPKFVSKLIILNAPVVDEYLALLQTSAEQITKSWYVFAFQIPKFIEELHAKNARGFFTLFRNTKSASELEAYVCMYSRPQDWTGSLNYYRSAYTHINPSKPYGLPQVIAPILVIWGTEDLALQRSLSTPSKEHVANVQTIYVEGANHFVHIDRPDEVNKLIEAFVK